MNITYTPRDGTDHGVTHVYGIIFEAGKPVNVEQALAGKPERERTRILDKIRGNPQFSIAGEKGAPAVDQGKAEQDKKLGQMLESRNKDAAKARETATRAQDEAAAKERAAAQVKAIADARNAPNEE